MKTIRYYGAIEGEVVKEVEWPDETEIVLDDDEYGRVWLFIEDLDGEELSAVDYQRVEVVDSEGKVIDEILLK